VTTAGVATATANVRVIIAHTHKYCREAKHLELQQAAADRVTTSGYDSLLEAEASLLFGASAVMFDNNQAKTAVNGTGSSAAGPRTAASTRTTAKGRAGTHVTISHKRTLSCLHYYYLDACMHCY
jgi:hypothetical protein